jgi:DMSO/TMAO reductase YedYZ molybdopterin-dependent catalytic subunit
MKPPGKPVPPANSTAEEQIRRLSRRSFLVGGAAALAGLAGWGWLRTRSEDGGLPWPLRRALEVNEGLARASFGGTRLAATFPVELAREPRVNGMIGLGNGLAPERWHLEVQAGGGPLTHLTLDEVKALPRAEMVTQLKCVEGWSVVVQWAGVRFADFIARYGPAQLPSYIGLTTPDDGYYVGLDRASALHPQTLLCYEMNGQLLTPAHGAPLRLVTAVKYGYKSIKRLGTVRFSTTRPADYWAERGYDWYAGH